ncbi:MAG TPA: tetratricopeptide repeat protein, partial [Isosphaeraceae bacterium]
MQRLQELDRAIAQHLDAGEIAEAIPPAREYLGLLERILGKDHWQTGDAHRSLETYQRLAGQTREVQNRYAKARQANGRARQFYDHGQYGAAALLSQEALSILRDILGEDHPDTATSYNNLA